MSVRQIMKVKEVLAIVPDSRKAKRFSACFEGEISPMAPASILRNHPRATVYLDKAFCRFAKSALHTFRNTGSLITPAAGYIRQARDAHPIFTLVDRRNTLCLHCYQLH